MKTILKHLSALLFVLCICFALTPSVARADDELEEGQFWYYLGDYQSEDADAVGVKLCCAPIDDTEELSVFVSDLKTGSGTSCDVVIPETITNDNTEYTVTAINGIDASINLDSIASFSCGKSVRTIPGNLFESIPGNNNNLNSWDVYKNDEPSSYVGNIRQKNGVLVPDTDAVLRSIPAFISDHYTDGGYYLGKCLLRVDPAYAGSFTVKSGTICILASAFEGCSSIGKVTIPSSVEFIGIRAFTNSSVTSVNLPAGLAGHTDCVHAYTFFGCSNLTEVKIASALTISNVGYCAFMDCPKLAAFDFTKVESISSMSFAGSFNKARITIRPEILRIRDGYDPAAGAFASSGITSLTFDNNTEENGYDSIPADCFYKCKNLATVKFSSSVKRLEAGCFDGCTQIKTDILAQSACCVEYLDFRCLANTGITKITLPESLKTVWGAVFANNPRLKTVDIRSTVYTPPLFAMLNDCTNSGPANYTVCTTNYDNHTNTKTDSGQKNNNYCLKPEKNGNTFVETVNLYCQTQTMLYHQPYLETVNYLYDCEQIPNDAFKFCPSLSEVSFSNPGALKTIGNQAFEFCPGLNVFPFEDLTGLESIGARAFMIDAMEMGGSYSKAEIAALDDERAGYGLFGTVDLSNCTKLKILGTSCFSTQFHVTELILPESLEKLPRGDNVYPSQFVAMPSLEKVTILCPLSAVFSDTQSLPAIFYTKPVDVNNTISVTNDVIRVFEAPNAGAIPNSSMFAYFIALESVTLGGTKDIWSGTFVNCISLQELHLPDAQTMGDTALYNTIQLETVDAPSLKTLDSFVFHSSGIKSIDLPAVESVGFGAFTFCKNLTDVSLPSLLSISESGSAGSQLFLDCNKLKSVDLGKCESIPKHTFLHCEGLENVKADSVKTVAQEAFLHSGIKTLDLPVVETVGVEAFLKCSNLQEVYMPSLKKIETKPDGAKDSSNLFVGTDIRIADLGNCEVIPANTFVNCDKLESVTAAGAKALGHEALLNCSVQTVSFPAVETVGYGAFMNCGNLETIALPSLKTIETNDSGYSDLFESCAKLDSVNLGNVTEIPRTTFCKSGIKSVSLPANVTYGAHVFSMCDNLETVIVEEGVKEIPNFMFSDCTNLKAVSLPASLETIGWGAFKNCGDGLALAIPENVALIQDDAFARTGVKMLLSGKPTIEILHERDESELYYDEDPARLPVENGSIIYCADEDVYTYTNAFFGPIASEYCPTVTLIPDAALTVSGSPEEVTAGEELATESLSVMLRDTALTEDSYTLDYDAADEMLGTRVVSVVADKDFADNVQVSRKNIKAKDIFGTNRSGQKVGFNAKNNPPEASFKVKVVPGVYTVTAGDGLEWIEDSAEPAAFTVERNASDDTTFGRFVSFTVNGEKLADTDYETAAGSLVLTLKTDYLKTLATGDYTAEFTFNDTGKTSALFKVKEAACTYSVSEGDKQEWTKGSGKDITLKVTRSVHDERTAGRFTGIRIDGKDVAADQYSVSPDAFVLTLKAAYLETLAEGKHAIEFVFADGTAAAEMTVKAPQTESSSADETKTDESTTAAPETTQPQETPTAEPASSSEEPTQPTTAPVDPTKQKGKDGTALGEGASAEAAEKAITGMKSDDDPAGAKFAPLTLKSSKQTAKSITLNWTKLKKAKKYVVYGSKCGKKNKPKKLGTATGKSKVIKKIGKTKLAKGTYYKFIVVALDKNNKVVSTSKLIHAATTGSKKAGNYKSVTVKAKVKGKLKTVSSVTVKKGKSLALKASAARSVKSVTGKMHVKIRYESSNTKIATVSKTGKIKAKAKGKCNIYVFAHNGVFKKIKVTVK